MRKTAWCGRQHVVRTERSASASVPPRGEGEIILDFDAEGHLLGSEVLRASRLLRAKTSIVPPVTEGRSALIVQDRLPKNCVNRYCRSMKAEEALSSYMEELRRAGRRPSTIRGYETDLRVLVRIAAEHGGGIDGDVVSEYLAWPTAQAIATRARRLSALRGLLRDCGRADLLPPHGGRERARAEEPPRRSSRNLRTEIDAVFAAMPHYADRDQLVFGLLAHLGLRPGEVLALQVQDFEEASASLYVTGWGGKRRRVLVDNRDVLLRLTNHLRFLAVSSGPLFTASGRDTPLRYQSVQHRWAQYCATAGVDVHLTDLRRAHVADLVAGGVPEAVIRDRIGQSTGSLHSDFVSFSSEDSDAQIREWHKRRNGQVTGEHTPHSSERNAG